MTGPKEVTPDAAVLQDEPTGAATEALDVAPDPGLTDDLVVRSRSVRQSVADRIDAMNDRSAKREPAPKSDPRVYQRPAPPQTAMPAPAADTADPSQPVIGTLDLVEEVVALTQRFGAFAHWPNEKKAYALGLVTRTARQLAIAQQVAAVGRRDSVHARAYRERRRLANEAKELVKAYAPRLTGEFTKDFVTDDPAFVTEALNYLGRFAKKVAALPDAPGEEA